MREGVCKLYMCIYTCKIDMHVCIKGAGVSMCMCVKYAYV